MRTLIVLIGIAAIVGAVWLAGVREAPLPAAPVTTLEVPAVPVVATEHSATRTPLAEAYAMAAFVKQTRDAMPTNEVSIRAHLDGLQVMWFLSDYVMASKSNADVALTVSGVASAFTNVSTNDEKLRERLRTYAIRDGTLADHYRDAMVDTVVGPEFAAVTNAMGANALPVDLDNDLLMDCLRYAYFRTFVRGVYGPKSDHYYPEALQAFNTMTDTTFSHRFTERFGLSADKASNLMASLQRVDVKNLTPASMQVPAKFK